MMTQELTKFRESGFELVRHRAVDQEVGGEVDHDQKVAHRLQAHHPKRRDVGVLVFYTSYLDICNMKDFLLID